MQPPGPESIVAIACADTECAPLRGLSPGLRQRALTIVLLLVGAVSSCASVESSCDRLPFDRIELEASQVGWRWWRRTTQLEGSGAVVRESHGRRLEGVLSVEAYGQLCEEIQGLGFFDLEPRYHLSGTHQVHRIVRVWPAGSPRPVIVSEYGDVGPERLHRLQELIRRAAGIATAERGP